MQFRTKIILYCRCCGARKEIRLNEALVCDVCGEGFSWVCGNPDCRFKFTPDDAMLCSKCRWFICPRCGWCGCTFKQKIKQKREQPVVPVVTNLADLM